MNFLITVIKSAFFDFSRNKGRTMLTSLGILIGVLSVVLLTAFGLGLKKFIQNQFESLGTNIVIILPGQAFKDGQFRGGASAFGGIRFDEKDVTLLKRMKSAEYVVPYFTKTAKVSSSENAGEVSDLYATSADIFPARNLIVQLGKNFTREQVDKRSKVGVLGPKIAEKLFKNQESALNKTIKIDGTGFKVIGILESKGGGGFGGPDFDSFVYIPYKTGFIFNPDKKFLSIILKARTDNEVDTLKSEITTTMKKRHKEDDFSVVEQREILNAITSIFGVLNSVLVAIAAISLVVGGIGIMNIMYVTVTERIKEIGVRRAIGARKSDILAQFLIEAVILSLFGGLLGLLLAYVITLMIQSIFPAYINLESIILALGVSSFIGIFFGVFPAKRATDISPIEAIRYE